MNTTHLGTVATVFQNYKNHDRAQELYERAIKADPDDANILGNYAKALFVWSRRKDALKKLRAAEAFADAPDELKTELAFYRFAHVDTDNPCPLKPLLEQGARTPGWSLQSNVAVAIKDGHPHQKLLASIAEVLCDGADINILQSFSEWQSCQ